MDTPTVGHAESSTVSVEFCVAVEIVEEDVVVVWLEEIGVLVDDDELCDVDDELVVGEVLLIEEALELEELEEVCDELDDVVVEELLDWESSTAAAAPMITITIMTTAITTL